MMAAASEVAGTPGEWLAILAVVQTSRSPWLAPIVHAHLERVRASQPAEAAERSPDA